MSFVNQTRRAGKYDWRYWAYLGVEQLVRHCHEQQAAIVELSSDEERFALAGPYVQVIQTPARRTSSNVMAKTYHKIGPLGIALTRVPTRL